MTFSGSPRPARRWHHASSDLRDFALISYRVEPERLTRALPDGFEVEQFDDFGLVSAVPFVDTRFHFRWMPLVKIDCGQVNYRTYVRYRGERGVWFFGTSLDTWLVAWPRLRWQMPWHRDRIRIASQWDGAALRSWSLAARGAWGDAECSLADGGPIGDVAGFRDRDHLLEVLCHPLRGWFERRDRRVASYGVWHHVLDPLACRVDHARFAVFERLDLVSSGERPHSAFVQRAIHFDVHMPPTVQTG